MRWDELCHQLYYLQPVIFSMRHMFLSNWFGIALFVKKAMKCFQQNEIHVKRFAQCVPSNEGFQWTLRFFAWELGQGIAGKLCKLYLFLQIVWSFWYWCSWDDGIAAAWFDIDYWDIDNGNIFQDNIDGRYIDQNYIARDDIDDGDIDHKDIENDMDDMDDVACIIIEFVASWWRKVVTAVTVTLKVFSHVSSSNDTRRTWARSGSSACPLQQWWRWSNWDRTTSCP